MVGQDTEGTGEPWEVLEERHDQHALSEAFLGRMTEAGGPGAGSPGRSTDHVPEGKDATACRGSEHKRRPVSPETERAALRDNQAWPCLWPPVCPHGNKDKRKIYDNEYLQVYLLNAINGLQLWKMLMSGEIDRRVHETPLVFNLQLLCKSKMISNIILKSDFKNV